MAIDPIVEALSGIKEGLDADGYILDVKGLDDGVLHITIGAQPGACGDCLVPKHMMAEMFAVALPAGSGVERIELTYPTELH